MVFKNITARPNSFFNLLPLDWQEAILPFWDKFKKSSEVYILEENDEIIAGGIVFSKCPPDLEFFKDEAREWFDKGYLYIGFIWVPENYRHQNFGSLWLKHLKMQDPNQKYWLTIEEENLRAFYEKNDFQYIKTLQNDSIKEQLFIYKCVG